MLSSKWRTYFFLTLFSLPSLLYASFLPLAKGAEWIYRVQDEREHRQVKTIVKEEKKVRGEPCFVLETEGRKGKGNSCVAVRKEGYFLLEMAGKSPMGNFSGQALTPPMPVLLVPLAQKKSWSWDGSIVFLLKKWKVRLVSRVEGKERVQVPAGAFTAWKIVSERYFHGKRVGEEVNFYAQGVGSIKSIVVQKGFFGRKRRIVRELVAFHP